MKHHNLTALVILDHSVLELLWILMPSLTAEMLSLPDVSISRGIARGGSKGSDEPPFQTKKILNFS